MDNNVLQSMREIAANLTQIADAAPPDVSGFRKGFQILSATDSNYQIIAGESGKYLHITKIVFEATNPSAVDALIYQSLPATNNTGASDMLMRIGNSNGQSTVVLDDFGPFGLRLASGYGLIARPSSTDAALAAFGYMDTE